MVANRFSGLERFSALFGGDGQIALSRYITVLNSFFKSCNRWPEWCAYYFWEFLFGYTFRNFCRACYRTIGQKMPCFINNIFSSLGHNWTRTVSKPSSRCWRSQVSWDRTVSRRRAVTPADQGFLAGDAPLTRSSLKMPEQISSGNLKSKYSKTSI